MATAPASLGSLRNEWSSLFPTNQLSITSGLQAQAFRVLPGGGSRPSFCILVLNHFHILLDLSLRETNLLIFKLKKKKEVQSGSLKVTSQHSPLRVQWPPLVSGMPQETGMHIILDDWEAEGWPSEVRLWTDQADVGSDPNSSGRRTTVVQEGDKRTAVPEQEVRFES